MKILIDTREQKPLAFSHPTISEVKRVKLEVGDYAVEFEDGHRPPIVFERKSKGDLWGTLTKGYERFKRELRRAKDENIAVMLIIEKSYTNMQKDYEYSKREASSVIKQIHTMHIRHGLTPVFCNTRDEMAKYITNFYISLGEGYVAKLKEDAKKARKIKRGDKT